jgi:mannose-6-phosphate isomerase-like protein (cupin superfamily)
MEFRKSMSSLLIKRENADHYVWGDNCDGWHLVRDTHLSVIEECMAAGAKETPHRHKNAQQFFYILSGVATMEVEDEVTTLFQGHGLRILPGMRHQMRNESSDPVRFLVISQPPSHGDRFNE